MSPTIGFDTEWAGIFSGGKRASNLVRCPRCGGVRMDLGGAHAPQTEAGITKDCKGEVINEVAEPSMRRNT